MIPDIVKVAAVQAAPIFMNKQASIEKACKLILEAGSEGARLIVFPESFLAGYPAAFTVGFDSESSAWTKAHLAVIDSSLTIPGPDCELLCEAAKRANAFVIIGCNELDNRPGSYTVFNSLLYLSPDGKVMGKHRKVMPTYTERLFHGFGDGTDLKVYDTEIGRFGGLICFENHMPLIKAVMMSQGQHIHAASWPGHWRGGNPGEAMNLSCTDINKCDVTPATRNYAVDAQCFVVSANLIMTMDDIPDDFPFKDKMNYTGEGQENFVCFCCGGSHIVNPFSEFIAGPVFGKEIILYAECDFNYIKATKVQIDGMGHYQRWDIANLQLNMKKSEPFTAAYNFIEDDAVFEKEENVTDENKFEK
ncbi:MAG: carbon-nitrogen hydrolase family protein [Desulfobacterales bacterium]|nr:carbon-nitrogen hydrolase family protein [Desulfobacterales bacterium]